MACTFTVDHIILHTNAAAISFLWHRQACPLLEESWGSGLGPAPAAMAGAAPLVGGGAIAEEGEKQREQSRVLLLCPPCCACRGHPPLAGQPHAKRQRAAKHTG